MRSVRSYKKVITVWLEPEKVGKNEYEKVFFCFNCRVPLIQYTGRVATLVPGGQPYQPSTILQCKGSIRKGHTWEKCGYFYCFMAAVHTKKPELE